MRKKYLNWILLVLIASLSILLLTACGDDSSNSNNVNPLSTQIIGEWLGECQGGNQTLRFNSSMTWLESDDAGGTASGTFSINEENLTLEVTLTDGEGCAPPALGTVASDISISNNVLTFIDFNPGTGDQTYVKQ